MSVRRPQPAPQQQKPITAIMNIKSNEDLRNYLQSRADLNLSLMRQKNQSSLLHFAAFKNEFSKMKIYIMHYEAFCRENSRRNRNQPAFQGQLRAWINHQNSDGFTALHFAALHGNIDMLVFLEQYGANMQIQSREKENVLFMCAENNHLKAAIYLLEHRQGRTSFDPNDQNHLGDTILHKAAKHGFQNFTSYLLSKEGVDIDARNAEGTTALMHAAAAGHKEIIKRMLMKGVNRHLRDNHEKRAIDIARELGKNQIARILNDQFTSTEEIKILCNLKVVYKIQKPSSRACILFLFLFHALFLPTNVLVEIDLFGQDLYYISYGLLGLYYLFVIVLFILLTRKHPKKMHKNLLQIQHPFCPQCRNTIKSTQFHCFICGQCISRYDHHCPWINNCISSYNIGKFTVFLALLILGCIEVIFISLCFYLNALNILKPNRFIDIPEGDQDKYYLSNTIISCFFATLFCAFLVFLFLDQVKNLVSNSTQYERAKGNKSSSLLSSVNENLESSINNDPTSEVTLEEQSRSGCFGNCCKMITSKYQIDD